MIMPAGSSVIATLRDVLEYGAELPEPFIGILGDRAHPVSSHLAGGVGIGHVLVEAFNCLRQHGVQMPTQLVQSQQVGQAVNVAVMGQ
jgi:hypothetical protein